MKIMRENNLAIDDVADFARKQKEQLFEFDLLCLVNDGYVRLPFAQGISKNPQGLYPIKNDGRYLKFEETEMTQRKFADENLVLNLGPMYHLFNRKDKQKAVAESIRVAKRNGICMFAYIPCAALMTGYGLRHQAAARLDELMDGKGRFKDIPAEVFNAFYIEDFKKLFAKTKTKYITNVATDGIAYVMREWLEQLPQKDYESFLKWHFLTCERLDQQGYSSHLLYICQKK